MELRVKFYAYIEQFAIPTYIVLFERDLNCDEYVATHAKARNSLCMLQP